jgi:TatD DNase family protein
MYIDTHAHLYLEQFDEDIDVVINSAINANVLKIYLPNIDLESIKKMHVLAKNYPDNCFPMMGLHPCSVKDDFESVLDTMKGYLDKDVYYGIGETGVDLYWDVTFKKEQITAFETQIEWAKHYKLPIIIHSRDSLDLTIEIIENHKGDDLTGIFHCFNGTAEQCRRIVDTNFMMGLGGVTTFKKANLDEMIQYMPMDLMLLETDAPYLAPTPFRGKRNESSYIPLIAKKVAEAKNIDISEIMNVTTANANRIFSKADN